VQLIQTHVSYVLLAGDYAYKIKKPVNFGFLNFSTLSRRRYYCRQEVILNSRLCADTYLGVVPVRCKDGHFVVGGPGETAEYAVKMRRLPADRMMDRLLARGELTESMLSRVAARLAVFHAAAGTGPRIAEYGNWAIRYAWDENIRQWAPNVGQTVTAQQDRVLRAYGEAFFARRADVLRRRVHGLRIRECHSDLRSDAVCISDGICIFDCVEFNRRIRLVDVARDVGFLAMDLDYRRRPDFAQTFVRQYIDASGDAEMAAVIDFYRCYNACVRGKVEGFLLGQPEVSAARKRRARAAARRYFALACRYAESLAPAMLVITCGLPATGKSTLAHAVSRAAGFGMLSSDVVRKELAGLHPHEHAYIPFEAGIYSPEFTDRTYAALLAQARERLLSGRSVILDAAFVRRSHRRLARRLARETGAQFVCIHLEAGDETIRRRLARRLRSGADPSDARWEIYAARKRRFQRPSDISPDRLITINAERPLSAQTKTVLSALRTLSPLSLGHDAAPRPSS
jgi:hypothetical protein